MLRNYILIALRQLWKNRFYSALNVVGLVAGVVCFLLITLYIAHDLKFDQYHSKKDRIYRLALGDIQQGVPNSSVTGAVMPHILQQEYAGIEKVVRFRKLPSLVATNDKSFFEERFFFADSTVFDVFTFPLLEGDAHTVLVEPYSLVLTEDAARRYFGRTTQVTGQLIQVDETMTFKVTGVLKNIPDFSHFKFDFLASASTLPFHPQESVRTHQLTGWFVHYFYNYLLLDENANPETVGKNILDAAKYHSDPEQYKLYGTNMGLFLQPLTAIHLNPLYGELEAPGDRKLLYILAGVATLILILACINFANINSALSIGRRKEVGLRKTLGAKKSQVVFQFMIESFLICLFTFILGLGLIELLLPWFNSFTGKQIDWIQLFDSRTILVLGLAVTLTALLGGVYPSLMAGRFSPASILKGFAIENRKFGFRKSVIVFQFVISMVLMAGSLVISSQVNHMLTKDLGLSTGQVIVLPMHGDPQLLSKLPVFFERLSQVPTVTSSTVCELIPGETVYGIIAKFEGHENVNYSTIGVGFDYLKTFQMELVAGRDFSRNQPLDTLMDRVIINETLAHNLGWTAEEAVGKLYDQGGDGEHPGEVIGVLKDFNFGSLKTEVSPMVLAYIPHFFDKAAIRIGSENMKASIGQIQQTWDVVYPSRPFDFRFADESVQQQYQSEEKFGHLFSCFSSLAILIGVLGLFGMVSLDMSLRTKEVGIRKVLGAGMGSLLKLLSQDFLKLILIAAVISIPLSYWLSQQWLANFAYRLTAIELLIALPALGVFLLALATVSLQTIKSANANPVDSLRNE